MKFIPKKKRWRVVLAIALVSIVYLLWPIDRSFVQQRTRWSTENLEPPAVAAWVGKLRDHAAMSELCYGRNLSDERKLMRGELKQMLTTAGWKRRWPEAGADAPADSADGLYYEVWVNERTTPPSLVYAFRGTEASDFSDWTSNLRWFLFGNRDEDQYAQVRALDEELGQFVDDLGGDVQISTTGHSLGGGLAQHLYYFSYSLKREELRIDDCRVFNSSPVTGALQMGDSETQERARTAFNARQASVAVGHETGESMLMKHGFGSVRAHESGEILEKFRGALRWVWPLADFITQVRFDFSRAPGTVAQHSMAHFADALRRYPNQ